jgi:L-ascorbate metabolism protein UlaG (beta-lactamase superfamily)
MSDDEWRIGAVRVRSVHAEHDAKRFPLSRRIPALGYVVSGSGRVYFAGSTDLFDGMSRLGDSIDVALLPVAPWSAKPARGRLDPGRGAIAIKRLRPRFAIPIQWGTSMRFAAPADPAALRKPAEEFARALADAAPEVTACILPVGGSLNIEVQLAAAR